MNTIICNQNLNLDKEMMQKKCTDYLIENFAFDKFKIIFEYAFKATVELEYGTYKGTATIEGIECEPEDRREKHSFSWDFINHEYNEDDVMNDKCECFEYDRKNYIKREIADDFQIETETMCILAYVHYIMTAKREKVTKAKGNQNQKVNKQKNKQRQHDKKVYLLDEIIEYVNGNGLTISKNGTHKINCPCWSVRGHYRHYKSGKVIFVKEYTKGKDRENTKPKDKTYTV